MATAHIYTLQIHKYNISRLIQHKFQSYSRMGKQSLTNFFEFVVERKLEWFLSYDIRFFHHSFTHSKPKSFFEMFKEFLLIVLKSMERNDFGLNNLIHFSDIFTRDLKHIQKMQHSALIYLIVYSFNNERTVFRLFLLLRLLPRIEYFSDDLKRQTNHHDSSNFSKCGLKTTPI